MKKNNQIQRLPNPYTEYHLREYPSKGRTLEVINEVIDRVNSIENTLEKLIKILEITLKED